MGLVMNDVSKWFSVNEDSRSWEDFYRKRWSYDYSVRTSHGVNCSMACSWEVFVKDGLICWELQKTDYPQIDPDIPNVEPRGCQRGVTASWYPYSPLRPKFPYVRKVLWDFYTEELKNGKDPVEAYASIVEDEERSKTYKSARGKAGWKRVSWDQAVELVVAGQIYTIKKYGPDHMANFSPIPAMSLLSFISGHRYNNLLGGIYCSYYEWYHDLPHVSASMFGDQTENCESSDWYLGTYWVVAGTNINMTRTADCHFLSEAKYRGSKIVVLSPNYSAGKRRRLPDGLHSRHPEGVLRRQADTLLHRIREAVHQFAVPRRPRRGRRQVPDGPIPPGQRHLRVRGRGKRRLEADHDRRRRQTARSHRVRGFPLGKGADGQLESRTEKRRDQGGLRSAPHPSRK
jgi:nitrate reductase alpha subunit